MQTGLDEGAAELTYRWYLADSVARSIQQVAPETRVKGPVAVSGIS